MISIPVSVGELIDKIIILKIKIKNIKDPERKQKCRDEYDLLLFDDDRPRNGLKELYQEAKKLGILTIGNRHGNVDFKEKELRDHLNICWDKLFLFGDKGYNIHLRSGVGSNENFLIGFIKSKNERVKLTDPFACLLRCISIFIPLASSVSIVVGEESSGLYTIQ